MRQRRSPRRTLLRSLKNTYQGTLTLLEQLKLQGQLLNPDIHIRSKSESVDTFAARTLQIHKELESNGVNISPHILKACFICGLGPEFTDIIRHLNNDSLPMEWQPISITQLLEPARQVLRLAQQQRQHNANYKAQNAKQQQDTPNTNNKNKSQNKSTKPTAPITDTERILKDRQSRIQFAINNDTFKIEDFEKEVQPGHCIFHDQPHGNLLNPSKDCWYLT